MPLARRAESRSAAIFVVCLVLLTAAAFGQGYVGPGGAPITGLPFVFDPGVSASGWHLNTRDDGIRNNGELAVDFGGAGATFPDPLPGFTPLPLAVTYGTVTTPDGRYTYSVKRYTGVLAGRRLRIVEPVGAKPGQAHPNFGACAGWLVISHPPTRGGSMHQPSGSLDTFDPPIDGFFLRGAATATVVDGRGNHPIVESTQNALFLSALGRLQLGKRTIVCSGGSYGGAIAVLQVLLFPDRFDGAFANGTALDLAEYDEWNAMCRMLEESNGRQPVVPIYATDSPGIQTLFGWRGLTPWNLDLTTAAGVAQIRRPTLIVVGGYDGTVITNGAADRANNLAAQLGINDIFQVEEKREAGHALAAPATTGLFGQGEPPEVAKFVAMVARFKAGSQPMTPLVPLPYARRGKYDSFLLEAKTSTIQTAPPAGRLLTLEDRLGGPAGAGQYMGAAVLRGDTLYHGDRAGWVYKKTWSYAVPGFVENWRSFVGTGVRSLAVGEIGGTLRVAAGSLRGLAVLDDASGSLWRESTPQNGGFGDVRSIAIGHVHPGSTGNQIAYQAMRMTLVVESAAGALLHTQEIGYLTKLIAESAPTPRLLAALSHGHVAALEFRTPAGGGPVVMSCSGISEYLQGTPADMSFVGQAAQRRLVVVMLEPGVRNYPIFYLDPANLSTRATFSGAGQALSVWSEGSYALVSEADFTGRKLSVYHVPSGASFGSFPIDTRWVVRQDPGAPGATGVVDMVGFGEETSWIDVYDFQVDPTDPVWRSDVRESTTAATHYLANPPSGPVWQTSLLRRVAARNAYTKTGLKFAADTWDIVFDVASGRWRLQNRRTTPNFETSYHDGNPANSAVGNYPSHRDFPAILVRLGSDETQLASFATMNHAGGVSDFGATTPLLYDSSCGRSIVSTDRWALRHYSVSIGRLPAPTDDIAHSRGIVVETLDQDPAPIVIPPGTGRAGYDFYAQDGWPSALDYHAIVAANMNFPDLVGGCPPGPQYGLVSSSPAGTIHVMDAAFCNLLPNLDNSGLSFVQRGGFGWCMTAIAPLDLNVPEDGVQEVLVAGSLLKNADGHTLWVLKPDLKPFDGSCRVDAGHVVGIATAGKLYGPSSPSFEFVVGAANGDLAIYSFNPAASGARLRLVHRENLGVLYVGGRRGMSVMKQPSGDVLIGATVDGGYMLLKIHTALLPAIVW